METIYLPGSGRLEDTAEPGVEWVGGQLQPSRFAHESMSAAIDDALELVLSLIATGCAEPATRRFLMQALAGTVDDELRRLDRETGTSAGKEVATATAERNAVLTALRIRIAAMLETDPPAASEG